MAANQCVVGLVALLLACVCGSSSAAAARFDGKLTINVLDEKSHKPVAVRMDLRDARGQQVRLQPEGAVVTADGIYFDGSATLELRRGAYTFLIEAGPEFITRKGELTIEPRAEDATEVLIGRRVDMRAEGWWSGDLDVRLPLSDLPLVMQARDLYFAPVTTMVNDRGKCAKLKVGGAEAKAVAGLQMFGPWAAADVRRGGGLLLIGEGAPYDVCRAKADEPSLPAATAAREAGACVVACSSTAWDLPLWVAAGALDAVQIMAPQPTAKGDDGQRPAPDKRLFPGREGPGRYREAVYHHLLNCGLRLPPAAGSGAGTAAKRGVEAAPLGANRVYVQCGETCTRETWLDGLRSGAVSVTNGPLLRTRVEGQGPGHVFRLATGEKHAFQIAVSLTFYSETQIEYLEVIKDGGTVTQVRLDELAKQAGKLPPVAFDSSGWFLVRAVTNNPDVYQFATTGPYYVEVEDRPRTSRASVQFFLDWLDDAAAKFVGNAAVEAEIEAARPFWQKLAEDAIAD